LFWNISSTQLDKVDVFRSSSRFVGDQLFHWQRSNATSLVDIRATSCQLRITTPN
jgi:hypothetical protein